MFFFLELSEAKNLLVLPYHVPIKPCSKPKPGPYSRVNKFEVDNMGVSATYKLTTLGCIIASALSRSKENGEQSHIPGWAGFKSLMSAGQCLTQVGALYHCCQKLHMSGLPCWLWFWKHPRWRIPESDFVRHGTVWEGSAVTGFKTWSERSSCPQTGWATWQTQE